MVINDGAVRAVINNKKNNKNSYNSNNNNNKNFDKNKKHYQNTNYNNQYNKKRHNNDVKVISTNINKDNNQNQNDKKRYNNNDRFNNNQNRDIKKDKKFNFNPFDNKEKSQQNQDNYKKDKQRYFNNQNKNQNKNNLNRQRTPRTIIPYIVKALKKEICSKCNRLINDMPNSIFNNQLDEYYHFDCILRELKVNNVLKNNQRLVYTGSGNFAIIEDITDNGRKKFVIKKSISYITKKEQQT